MEAPVNLLALDGGGIRGLSELLILHEIMKRIRFDAGLEELPRPCDYFHLIGGTSTGGLIAIMLGRLGMSTDAAIREYIATASAVFSKSNCKPYYKGDTFKASTLERKVRDLVAARATGDRMMAGKAPRGGGSPVGDAHHNRSRTDARIGSGCRAFVCAMPASNMAHPQRFRTYAVRENAGPDCLIWEAARATTAVPTLFKRIAIAAAAGHAPQAFVDGGIRCNNPVREVIEEARAVFGSTARLGCLVSLGAGRSADVIGLAKPNSFQRLLPINLLRMLKTTAADCEQEAQRVARQFGNEPGRYFRFSVAHGASGISLEEWERMDELMSHTNAYLQDVEVSRSIDELVKLLCEPTRSSSDVPTIVLSQLCGDVLGTAPQRPNDSSRRIRRRHAPTALFTGREEMLSQLDAYFPARGAGSHPQREFLLFGMGGSGKSQIALKFAEEYQERFSQVFWLDATNIATIEQSYKEIAWTLRGAASTQMTVDAAREELSSRNGEWLLIVDGADDANDMAELWPPGVSGNILYTSRNPVLKDFAPQAICEVAEMEQAEAVELLLNAARLWPATKEVAHIAHNIVAELGSLALAVDQAGAFIARCECRVNTFLATFKQHRTQLLGSGAFNGASPYERAVYATGELAYAALERKAGAVPQDNPECLVAQNAIQLLNLLAFFHYENVMEDIFKRAAEDTRRRFRYPCDLDPNGELSDGSHLPDTLLPLDDGKRWHSRPFYRAISMLCSYSLLAVDKTSGAISMHRLVHGWVFDRQSPNARLSYLRTSAAVLASAVRWELDSAESMFRRSLLPHLTALIRHGHAGNVGLFQRAVAKRRIAEVFRNAGRVDDAVALGRHLFELRQEMLGPDHPETLRSLGYLAMATRQQGRTAEAEAMHWQEFELSTRVLGPKHHRTLKSLGNLALTIQDQGRAAEAEDLHRRELRLKKQVFGPEHPMTLACMGSLASVIRQQGRALEAEELHRQELELQTKVLGPEHPITLACMGNLAMAVRQQGRAEEAEKLHRQEFRLKKRVLGPEHPWTLASMGNLAETIGKQGRAVEAEELHRQELVLKEQLLGPNHPLAIVSKHNHAMARHALGFHIEALDSLRKCYQQSVTTLGADHPSTKASLAALHAMQVQDNGAY